MKEAFSNNSKLATGAITDSVVNGGVTSIRLENIQMF